jgi:hypothetical protein
MTKDIHDFGSVDDDPKGVMFKNGYVMRTDAISHTDASTSAPTAYSVTTRLVQEPQEAGIIEFIDGFANRQFRTFHRSSPLWKYHTTIEAPINNIV